jgi:uncharacterized phage protein (TIGR01671 family)
MRELKFRIWDKQNKNWIKENGQSLHCFSNWSICPFTGKLTDYVGAIDGDHGETYTANPAPDYYITDSTHERNLSTFTALVVREPRYVIQQYTGLKDKNGKEIYEGDIVKTVDGASDRTRHFASWGVEFAEYTHGEVKWLREGFEVCQESIGATRLSVFSCDYFSSGRTSDLEIIGNIFENSELLKQ